MPSQSELTGACVLVFSYSFRSPPMWQRQGRARTVPVVTYYGLSKQVVLVGAYTYLLAVLRRHGYFC